jgi:hypothetical protein
MDLRIVLSSTLEDLKGVRERIRQHLAVIPAEVIAMEMFGSDESKPLSYSLEQVRKANLFIGVYAERYGTIDSSSGLSITELEYREAKQMLDAGRLKGLLVYILDGKAKWPVNLVERDPAKTELLLALKTALKSNHTVVFFEDPEDLSLNVLRDVLRKVGLTAAAAFKPKASLALPPLPDARVLGMEHYTEGDAQHFRGRESAIADLLKLIDRHPLTLLIGDSGIGKTSLLHAGLVPAVKHDGWAVASCRPLDNPDSLIPRQLWPQLMESPFPPGTPLSTVLGIVGAAHESRRVMVVIDQFEDAIPNLGRATTVDLLDALTRSHCTPIPNVRLLLAYRGDADAKVGRHWQRVSGSPSGLPRYYLEPLSHDAAKRVLLEALAPFIAHSTEASNVIDVIVADLSRETADAYGDRVYPPFLQMVTETLTGICRSRKLFLSEELYSSLSGAHEIIGRYLVNQLRFLDHRQGDARTLLLALASKRSRLLKSVDELVKETGLSQPAVESVLQQLSDLRLVRRQGESWEVVHDYLAARIAEELSDPEEQEARTFRNVLIAKTAVFEKTKGVLTEEEQLGVYAHRRRIACSPDEIRLLFISSLAGRGPCAFYLTGVASERVLEWARIEAAALDDETDVERETTLNALRYLLKKGENPNLATLAEVFGDYKLQTELAAAISTCATKSDLPLLLRLRNNRAELVAQAAREAIERFTTPFDGALLKKMLRSGKPEDIRILCRVLAAVADEGKREEYRSALENRSLSLRAAAASALGVVGSSRDMKLLASKISKASKTERLILAYAIARWAQKAGDGTLLRRLLKTKSVETRLATLYAVEKGRAGLTIEHILKLYTRFPRETGSAVRRSVEPHDSGELRKFVVTTPPSPFIRDILIAIVTVGGPDAVRFVLDLIASCGEAIEIWNVPILAAALASAADRSVLPSLLEIADNEEFWRYVGRERGERPLSVARYENLYLFKRLAGVCLAHICTESEWPLLRRLISHDYRIVQMEAARRITKFATTHHLDTLIADSRTRQGKPDSSTIDAICAIDEAVYA